jgi:hypothetical protein
MECGAIRCYGTATRRYGSLYVRAARRYQELPDHGRWLRADTIRGTCLRGYHGYFAQDFAYQALRNQVLFPDARRGCQSVLIPHARRSPLPRRRRKLPVIQMQYVRGAVGAAIRYTGTTAPARRLHLLGASTTAASAPGWQNSAELWGAGDNTQR